MKISIRQQAGGNGKQHKLLPYALCAMLFALCVPAGAQQPAKVPRIGFLFGASPSSVSARIEAFRQGLRELGYVERKNIVIEYRSAEGKLDRLAALAAELARLKADVMVTGGPQSTRAAKEATVTIPIVISIMILLAMVSSTVLRDRAETLQDSPPFTRR